MERNEIKRTGRTHDSYRPVCPERDGAACCPRVPQAITRQSQVTIDGSRADGGRRTAAVGPPRHPLPPAAVAPPSVVQGAVWALPGFFIKDKTSFQCDHINVIIVHLWTFTAYNNNSIINNRFGLEITFIFGKFFNITVCYLLTK